MTDENPPGSPEWMAAAIDVASKWAARHRGDMLAALAGVGPKSGDMQQLHEVMCGFGVEVGFEDGDGPPEETGSLTFREVGAAVPQVVMLAEGFSFLVGYMYAALIADLADDDGADARAAARQGAAEAGIGHRRRVAEQAPRVPRAAAPQDRRRKRKR